MRNGKLSVILDVMLSLAVGLPMLALGVAIAVLILTGALRWAGWL